MSNRKAMKAVIYARQSLTREGSESLETQVQVCREAAPRLGCEIVAELVEPPSTSGYKHRGTQRQKFKELLAGFRDQRWEVVIAYKTDRLSRGGGPGWAPLLEVIEGADLDLDRAVATPSGFISEFEIGIRASMDREESKKTSERLRDVIARNAANGKPHGGRRPYGYEADRVTINKSEADVLLEMARRVISGHTPREVARSLNKRGSKQFTSLTVWRMLHNKRYAGIRSYNGEDFPAQWPAIFDKPTWEKLQLAFLLRQTDKPIARKYLLTGLIYCGKCGARMHGATRDNGKRGSWRTYICPASDGAGMVGCHGVRRQAEPIEDMVVTQLLQRLEQPELGATLIEDDRYQILSDMLVERKAQKRRLDKLIDQLATGLLTEQEFKRAKSTAAGELQRIDDDINRLNRERIGVDTGDLSFREAWEQSDSEEWRRSLLAAFIKRIDVMAGRTLPWYEMSNGKRCRFDPSLIQISWQL